MLEGIGPGMQREKQRGTMILDGGWLGKKWIRTGVSSENCFRVKAPVSGLPRSEKYGTLHEFACHPCAGAMLIFSVSFQF